MDSRLFKKIKNSRQIDNFKNYQIIAVILLITSQVFTFVTPPPPWNYFYFHLINFLKVYFYFQGTNVLKVEFGSGRVYSIAVATVLLSIINRVSNLWAV